MTSSLDLSLSLESIFSVFTSLRVVLVVIFDLFPGVKHFLHSPTGKNASISISAGSLASDETMLPLLSCKSFNLSRCCLAEYGFRLGLSVSSRSVKGIAILNHHNCYFC